MTDYSALLNNENQILNPTITNRFRFKGFHFLSNGRNEYLTFQTISVSFTFDQSIKRDFDDGLWTVNLIIEDDAKGGVTNIINDVVHRFKKKYNKSLLEFDILDSDDTIQSVLNLTNATLTDASFDLDYADNMTAKWKLTFNVNELTRTT